MDFFSAQPTPEQVRNEDRRRLLHAQKQKQQQQHRQQKKSKKMTASEQSVEVISSRFFSASANSKKEDHHPTSSAAAAAAAATFLQEQQQHSQQREQSWLNRWNCNEVCDDDEESEASEGVNEGVSEEESEESEDNDDSVYENESDSEQDDENTETSDMIDAAALLIDIVAAAGPKSNKNSINNKSSSSIANNIPAASTCSVKTVVATNNNEDASAKMPLAKADDVASAKQKNYQNESEESISKSTNPILSSANATTSTSTTVSAAKTSYVNSRDSEDGVANAAAATTADSAAPQSTVKEPYRFSPLIFNPFKRMMASMTSSKNVKKSSSLLSSEAIKSTTDTSLNSIKTELVKPASKSQHYSSDHPSKIGLRNSAMTTTSQLTTETGLASSQLFNKSRRSDALTRKEENKDISDFPRVYVDASRNIIDTLASTPLHSNGTTTKPKSFAKDEDDKQQQGDSSLLVISQGDETPEGMRSLVSLSKDDTASSIGNSSNRSGVSAIAAAVLSKLTKKKVDVLVEERKLQLEEQQQQQRQLEKKGQTQEDKDAMDIEMQQISDDDTYMSDEGSSLSSSSGNKKESGGLAFLASVFVFLLIGLTVAANYNKDGIEIVSASSLALDVPIPEGEASVVTGDEDGDPCSTNYVDGGGRGRILRHVRKDSPTSVFFVRRRITMNHNNKHNLRRKRRSLESTEEDGSAAGLSHSKCDDIPNASRNPVEDAEVAGEVGPAIDDATTSDESVNNYVLDHVDLSMKSQDNDSREEGIRRQI